MLVIIGFIFSIGLILSDLSQLNKVKRWWKYYGNERTITNSFKNTHIDKTSLPTTFQKMTHEIDIEQLLLQRDIEGLLKALEINDVRVRIQITATFARMTLNGDADKLIQAGVMPKLVELLDDRSEYTPLPPESNHSRDSADFVMGSLNPYSTIADIGGVIGNFFEYKGISVRENVAGVLSGLIDAGEKDAVVNAGAIPKLVLLLHDKNPKARLKAANIFYNLAQRGDGIIIADAGAVIGLINLLDDIDKDVCINAFKALESIAEKTPEALMNNLDQLYKHRKTRKLANKINAVI